ncbi:uroporphyrinogen-III C-methyltransferase [Cellulomonas cellasea]|uniref:uroporphyrinogen-III C-methyltransferase n=1 Tax=Cellulomonas cellasea TaxID=43670 RepID=A0A7W4YBA7_9CELL|nr:uroporphyrinogen-III C-methyltransferase [Cellulomonas cellasea]MBB2922839.1 uroporphyrin-III C-methyltransferase/precorrin-2 dehydrogenase/sirohydrochlorin ferrochelatase [Cellulomonas cellasea]
MTALLGLRLTGRRVVVAGGGPVAARLVQDLLVESPRVLVVAPQLCEALLDMHRWGLVEWRAAEVRAKDLDGAWLVQTATGDRATDAAVAGWAEERRVFCVTSGDVRGGTARTPATTRLGDVLVGVVATSAGSTAGPSTGTSGAPGAPGPADARRIAGVRDSIAAHLRRGGADLRHRRAPVPGQGRVVLVGGGPGAVDLLTVRARQALAEADVVVTDRLGPTAVLHELPADVEVIDVGKTPGNHAVPQHEINRILVERAQRGELVVRLKGGDPFVYGRGGEEVLACREAGVPVTVVPGVSSAFAVPAAAGIPLTHRGTVGSVQVVNGHDGLSRAALAGLCDASLTLVVLMGVSMLDELVATALGAGTDPVTPVAIIESGTLDAQRVTRAPLDGIAAAARAAGVRAPAVIVVGAVAADGLLVPPPPPDDGPDTRPTSGQDTMTS